MSEPAAADTGGSVVTDDSGADIDVGADDSTPGNDSSGESDCTYRPLNIPEGTIVYDLDGNPIEVDGTGQWYEKWCGTVFYGAIYISPTDPTDLLVQARNRLDLPLPTAGLSPSGEQVVNLETWLWIDPAQWQTLSASASVPGITVTVFATPQHTIWSMGDGAVVECGAGTPYDLDLPAADQVTSCSHLYRRSSAGRAAGSYSASVTVRWHLTWSVNDAPAIDLETIDRTSTFSVAVAEIQAVNVATGGSS
ncbi:MAG: hypothetical protein AB7O92_23230 [Acidimicrobiia bacterium]